MKRHTKTLPNELPPYFFSIAKKKRDAAKKSGLTDPPKKIWRMSIKSVKSSPEWKEYKKNKAYSDWRTHPDRTWNLIKAEQARAAKRGRKLTWSEASKIVSQRKKAEKAAIQKAKQDRDQRYLLTNSQVTSAFPKLIQYIRAKLISNKNAYPIAQREAGEGVLIATTLIEEENFINSIVFLIKDMPTNAKVKIFSLFLTMREITSLFRDSPLFKKICAKTYNKDCNGRCYHFLFIEETQSLYIAETEPKYIPYSKSCGYGFDISVQSIFDIHDFNTTNLNQIFPLSILGVITSKEEPGRLVFENLCKKPFVISDVDNINFFTLAPLSGILAQFGARINVERVLSPVWEITSKKQKSKKTKNKSPDMAITESQNVGTEKSLTSTTELEQWSATKAWADFGSTTTPESDPSDEWDRTTPESDPSDEWDRTTPETSFANISFPFGANVDSHSSRQSFKKKSKN